MQHGFDGFSNIEMMNDLDLKSITEDIQHGITDIAIRVKDNLDSTVMTTFIDLPSSATLRKNLLTGKKTKQKLYLQEMIGILQFVASKNDSDDRRVRNMFSIMTGYIISEDYEGYENYRKIYIENF